MNWQLPIGAQADEQGVRFRVWSSNSDRVDVVIFSQQGEELATHPLRRDEFGYFVGRVEGMTAGVRYMYRLAGENCRPDPASRYQPDGVHGPSEVVSPVFDWQDSAHWQGIPADSLIIYEVHIGTATPEGTFKAFIEKLDYVKSLGATAIEIMPVADFPGNRNWGYDGVCLFAPAQAYGRPEDLKKLVDEAHARGLAVIQDVVYNHLGPDGNYLRDFSKEYFTEEKKTPWGDAINYSCEAVREFFISNALYWAKEFHMDGLRLDATHAILDDSEKHVLQEIIERVQGLLPENRQFVFIAEDDRNSFKLISPPEEGGIGLDAQWADDFHHQVRSVFAGDNEGYFVDYSGSAADIAKTLNGGWFYQGQYSEFAKKNRGTDASQLDPYHFVYCIQNHDQIGNRPLGDRLNSQIEPQAYRAASALLLLSPATPMLFQGQEWAATTPFLFFTDHNPDLGKLVTEGRRSEFEYFSAFNHLEVPDPQAEKTFQDSKLKWGEAAQGSHAATLELYRDLLALRRGLPCLRHPTREAFHSQPLGENAVALRYAPDSSDDSLLVVVNLKGQLELDLNKQEITRPKAGQSWQLKLNSNDLRYGGQQNEPQSFSGSQLHLDGPAVVALVSGS